MAQARQNMYVFYCMSILISIAILPSTKRNKEKIKLICHTKFINCCNAGAHLRWWHIYVCITNSLLFRDILEKKIKLSLFLPVMLKAHIGAYLANQTLIWQWQMSLDVASQCKGNGLIEIFVQVFGTGRQKYLMADGSTLEGHHWKIGQFWNE